MKETKRKKSFIFFGKALQKTGLDVALLKKSSIKYITNSKFDVPRISNYYGDRTLRKRLPFILNSLPVDIRNETNKINLKSY